VSHTKKPKAQKPKAKNLKKKPQSKKHQSKAPKEKASFSESFISSSKQGGAAVLRESDIVTGETCVPASPNVNNLGEAVVLHFPLL
jgi:hypothetical protein